MASIVPDKGWRGRGRAFGWAACLLAFAVLGGCAKKDPYYVYGDNTSSSKRSRGKEPDVMYGKVVDRNDKPLARVTIRVAPGEVERVSNKWGEYEVEYLFSDEGERKALSKNSDYTISAWKPGYHEQTQIFRYEGGSSEIPTITLVEDSIELSPENILDPSTLYQEPTSDSVGQSYEE